MVVFTQSVQTLVLMAGVAVVVPLALGQYRLGWFPTIVWIYFALRAAVVAFSPWYSPPGVGSGLVPLLQWGATESFAATLGLPLLVMEIPRRWFTNIFFGLTGALALDGGWMIYRDLTTTEVFGFLGTWSTFETAMMACLLPFCFMVDRFKVVSRTMGVWLLFVIGWFHGSTSLLCAATALAVWLYCRRLYVWLLPLGLAGLGAVWWKGDALLASGGRLQGWLTYFKWWEQYANPWIGVGAGSFEFLGPQWPIPVGDTDVRMRMMHNDLLQILFEYGFIGFVLLLALSLYLMGAGKKMTFLRVTLAAIFVCMLTYFPLHFGFSQVFALMIARVAIDRRLP